jgi:hypothetical protein
VDYYYSLVPLSSIYVRPSFISLPLSLISFSLTRFLNFLRLFFVLSSFRNVSLHLHYFIRFIHQSSTLFSPSIYNFFLLHFLVWSLQLLVFLHSSFVPSFFASSIFTFTSYHVGSYLNWQILRLVVEKCSFLTSPGTLTILIENIRGLFPVSPGKFPDSSLNSVTKTFLHIISSSLLAFIHHSTEYRLQHWWLC